MPWPLPRRACSSDWPSSWWRMFSWYPLFVLCHPKLHTILKVRLHQCSVEWDRRFLWPAGNAVLDAPQFKNFKIISDEKSNRCILNRLASYFIAPKQCKNWLFKVSAIRSILWKFSLTWVLHLLCSLSSWLISISAAFNVFWALLSSASSLAASVVLLWNL